MKARVDQQAPRVVVRQVNRDRFVWSPSISDGDPNPLDRGDLMMFLPKQKDEPLFVRVDLRLRNEGVSSGWVSCSQIDFLGWPASSVARAYFVGPMTRYERGRVA